MADFLQSHWLDLFTTILGLIYIWLEYRAHIALCVVMPALDVWLYWSHGLYGDAGMACYYTFAALYGFYVWKYKKTRKKHESLPIIFMPRDKYLPAIVFFFAAWGATYYVLVTWTNSTVPVLDSFTNALSIVALWALARKFVEQWLFWIVVDAVCSRPCSTDFTSLSPLPVISSGSRRRKPSSAIKNSLIRNFFPRKK